MTLSVTSSLGAPLQDLAGYPRILGIVDLRPLLRSACLQRPPGGRPCQTLCSYARRSRCFCTLFDQDHALVFLIFLSIKPAMLSTSMLGDYSTSASTTPFLFSSSYQPDWETRFSSRQSSTYCCSFFWTIISAILPATMLGYYS
jgi:hypothetical protein